MRNKRVKRYARRLDDKRKFNPEIKLKDAKSVIVYLDEFEAMRLCDFEELSQVDAADDMQVSRATLQRLLQSGRKKVVKAVLSNTAFEVTNDIHNIRLKGENKMNVEQRQMKVIAFPTSDRTTVDGHFGHTKEFAIVSVSGNEVVGTLFVTPPPHEPGVLPRFLGQQGIDVIVTGGMGKMAVDLFNQQGIDVILGATGSIDENLIEYLGGSLASSGSVCSHDHGEHHGH